MSHRNFGVRKFEDYDWAPPDVELGELSVRIREISQDFGYELSAEVLDSEVLDSAFP
jgi:hypothetical protein